MENARLIGLAGMLLLSAGGGLLWARPEPAGYETENLGASLFVLGTLIAVLALLAWDGLNAYDERDVDVYGTSSEQRSRT